MRLDQWLWYARFFKTRTLASNICRARSVRVNGTIQRKASLPVRVDDILTFSRGEKVRVVRILALTTRRGPYSEAQMLYEDLSPPETGKDRKGPGGNAPSRDKGAGRPTKKDRRAIDRLME